MTEAFIIEFDVPDSGECDAFAQECPEGQKCAPYADDGGSSWNNTKRGAAGRSGEQGRA